MIDLARDFDSPSPPSRPKRVTARAMARSVLLGIVIASIAAAVVGWLVLPAPLPGVTRDAWTAAHDQWQRQNIDGYDLRLAVTGDQPGEYFVRVRGGEVVGLVLDGVELKPSAAWANWSVSGLLEVIGDDLESIDQGDGREPNRRAQDDEDCRLRLSGTFDPQYGYPARYRRIMLDTGRWVEWEVVEFRPL